MGDSSLTLVVKAAPARAHYLTHIAVRRKKSAINRLNDTNKEEKHKDFKTVRFLDAGFLVLTFFWPF